MQEFQRQVEYRERIARDNLAYFEANGFLALTPHFDSFLATLNRHMLSVDPQAGSEITLPKEFSEKDRAFLARGLVMALGGGAKTEDYFEIPGYRLKEFDASGTALSVAWIKSKLESSKVIKGGSFQQNTLESIFTDTQRTNK